MDRIRNGEDLRRAYDALLFLQGAKDLVKESFNQQKYEAHLCEQKKMIRAYHRKQASRTIVRDDGIDGYVEKVLVPVACQTNEDREQWFESEELLTCRHPAYDCTGDLFTGWYRFAKQHGVWYLFHGVYRDV